MSTSSDAAPWRVAVATFIEIEIHHPHPGKYRCLPQPKIRCGVMWNGGVALTPLRKKRKSLPKRELRASQDETYLEKLLSLV